MKNILIVLGVLIIVGAGAYFYMSSTQQGTTLENVETTPPPEVPDSQKTQIVIPGEGDEAPEPEMKPEEVIGTSADGNDITAYHFGDGNKEVLFVGGVHGGYSFNTALIGFELVDYLTENADAVPDDVMVTVIPVLNPDGLEAVTGSTGRFDGSEITKDDAARVVGRFNGNEVDLNRNFDCEWNETGTWQSQEVSGGSAPFSEPEAKALRDYVKANKPVAAVVYYSQAGGVYSSTCDGEVSPEVAALTNLYANAAGYGAYEEFDYYEITGDMVNWMTGEGIPSISVLLTNHEETEWSKNRVGIEAILEYFGE